MSDEARVARQAEQAKTNGHRGSTKGDKNEMDRERKRSDDIPEDASAKARERRTRKSGEFCVFLRKRVCRQWSYYYLIVMGKRSEQASKQASSSVVVAAAAVGGGRW